VVDEAECRLEMSPASGDPLGDDELVGPGPAGGQQPTEQGLAHLAATKDGEPPVSHPLLSPF
jgi:hypothetical protein